MRAAHMRVAVRRYRNADCHVMRKSKQRVKHEALQFCDAHGWDAGTAFHENVHLCHRGRTFWRIVAQLEAHDVVQRTLMPKFGATQQLTVTATHASTRVHIEHANMH